MEKQGIIPAFLLSNEKENISTSLLESRHIKTLHVGTEKGNWSFLIERS